MFASNVLLFVHLPQLQNPDTFCESSSDQPSQIVLLSDLFESFPTVPINIDIKVDDDRLVEAVSVVIVYFSSFTLNGELRIHGTLLARSVGIPKGC